MRKLWKCFAKKTGKLTCFIAERIREKGGFTFGPADLGKPCPVPEIDRLPEDKSHHLGEEDVLGVTIVQLEALVRQAKKYSECANKHNAHVDAKVFNFIAVKLEKGAQAIRGMITPRDLKVLLFFHHFPYFHLTTDNFFFSLQLSLRLRARWIEVIIFP